MVKLHHKILFVLGWIGLISLWAYILLGFFGSRFAGDLWELILELIEVATVVGAGWLMFFAVNAAGGVIWLAICKVFALDRDKSIVLLWVGWPLMLLMYFILSKII